MSDNNAVKTVSFTEYGGELDRSIVRDGKRLALLLTQTAPLEVVEQVTSVLEKMRSTFSPSGVNAELDEIFALVEEDYIGGHSGASWSAVLWACANLLTAHTVAVDGILIKLVGPEVIVVDAASASGA